MKCADFEASRAALSSRREWAPPAFLFGRFRCGICPPVVCLLLALCSVPHAGAQPARWTAAEWLEDLEYLRVRIGTAHANPARALGDGPFQEGYARLREAIPALDDAAIAIEMQRLVASLGDGHSWLNFNEQNLVRWFLFEAYEFSDGLYITRAGAGNDSAAGMPIIAIDGVPVETVRSRLAPYISRDNDMELLRQIPLLIRHPEVLHAAGITQDPGRAAFTLRDSRGVERTVQFRGEPEPRFLAWQKKQPAPADRPLYRRNEEDYYWYTALPSENALYFQFNRFWQKPEKPFSDFIDDWLADADQRNAGCLIIDLRHNSGGFMRMVEPLVRRLRKHPRYSKRNHLYLITGRASFSSSLMLVVRLQRQTGALIAGEPCSGKPNGYGEYNHFELPHSRLTGSLSRRYFQESEPFDQREEIAVDLPAPIAYDDFQNNRDPALEAVLEHWRRVRSEKLVEAAEDGTLMPTTEGETP